MPVTIHIMGGEAPDTGITIDSAAAASTLAWWLEMGVDVAVQDAPRDWLKPAAKPVIAGVVAEPGAAPAPNIAPPSHDTLAELQNWLASSTQLPLASATARRILPIGPEEAPVMLLSDAPTLEDLAAGQPIGGEAWALTQRMLAAIGIKADEAYIAPLSCFHSPGQRLRDADLAECADVARRHIVLAKPKRLLLLGDAPARALLGKPLASARGHLHKVEGVPTVVTFHPRHLLKRGSDKALAWRDLLLLMEDQA
jgi:uracil-DNA glycosylase family 4